VLLDSVLIVVLAVVVGLVLGATAGNDSSGAVVGVILYAVFLLYAPLMLAFNDGQTVGKKALSIAVVKDDGGPIGFGRALWRELVVRFLLGILVIPGIVDVLWPLWDKENRALHDMAASTRVIVR
jgi:uncharacterized RDD family membrane protein YckC